jgi:hypothetical protein
MKLLVLRIILHTINFFYLVVRRAHTEIWIKINRTHKFSTHLGTYLFRTPVPIKKRFSFFIQ